MDILKNNANRNDLNLKSKLAIKDLAEKFTPNKFEFPNFERGHFVIKFSGVTPISVNIFNDHQMI